MNIPSKSSKFWAIVRRIVITLGLVDIAGSIMDSVANGTNTVGPVIFWTIVIAILLYVEFKVARNHALSALDNEQ